MPMDCTSVSDHSPAPTVVILTDADLFHCADIHQQLDAVSQTIDKQAGVFDHTAELFNDCSTALTAVMPTNPPHSYQQWMQCHK